MTKTDRHYAWCFTLNNYTDEEIQNIEENKEKYRYIVYGREIAPTTGTPHLQGYIAFNDGKTMSAVKKNTNCKRMRLTPANGSAQQNRDYCSKEDENFVEHGDMPTQGKRTDLDGLASQILEGTITEEEIIVNTPSTYHQYGRTINRLQDLALRRKWRTEMTEGIWICGATGTGKSHQAFEGFHPDTHYLLPNDNGWWDGYTGQETVIINEFRGEIKYKELLELIDKWPKSVKRRGREPAPLLAKKIIITSSMEPHEVYHNLAENDRLEQLLRRIKIIRTE